MTNEENVAPKHDDGDEILDAVQEELYSRLEGRPSAKDRLAIRTALAKAVARGQARGAGESPDSAAEIDFWAEEYSDGTEEQPPERSPDVGTAIRDLADALGNAVASAGQELAKVIRGSGDR